MHLSCDKADRENARLAYSFYKSGQYRDAIPLLQDLLDLEPDNWEARLFLAACFFKTGLPMAAQKSFRVVLQTCPDATLKQQACRAFEFVNASIEKEKTPAPGEFRSWAERLAAPSPNIEHIIN